MQARCVSDGHERPAAVRCPQHTGAFSHHLYAERSGDGQLLAEVDLVPGQEGDAVAKLHLHADDRPQPGLTAEQPCRRTCAKYSSPEVS